MEQIYPLGIKKYESVKEFRKKFVDFFWNICIQESDKNSLQKIWQIDELIRLNIPNKLYKYRAVTEYSLLNFIEDEFVCSKAKTFNDPYDSLLYFDISALQKYIIEFSNKEHILKSHKKILEDFETSGRKIEDLTEQEKRILSLSPEQIVYYFETDFRESNLKMLTNEIKNLLTSKQEILKNQSYIGCLAENNNCPLMWGHYADSHKGFCLEYDLSDYDDYIKLKANYVNLYPVHYTDNRYCANELGMYLTSQHLGAKPQLADTLFWNKAFTCKSLSWEYEKEWRIICNQEQQTNEDRIFLPLKPKAIYYGESMDKKTKDGFRKIARKKGIKEYEIKLAHDEKKFILTPELL